jgi:hypothetical protein
MNKKICACFIGLSLTLCLFGQNVQIESDSDLCKERLDTLLFKEVQLSDKEIYMRLSTLQGMLDNDQKGSELWWYGWLGIYSAATIGQGALAFFSNDKTIKQDMTLGAGTTLFGIVGQFITPPKPNYINIQPEQFQNLSKEERLFKLMQAEKMLKDKAEYVKVGKSWEPHAIGGVVNITSGLITWLGYKRSLWDGIENFALNTFVTEIQIWSLPTKAMMDYNTYINKYNLADSKNLRKRDFVCYSFVIPGGIGVRIGF